MTLNSSCATEKHSECSGRVHLGWGRPTSEQTVVDSYLLDSDGVRVYLVACECSCHPKEVTPELEPQSRVSA